MARRVFLLALLATRLLPFAAAQDDNQFISPSPNDGDVTHIEGSFAEGDLMKLSWKTTWDIAALVLWQNGVEDFHYLPNSAPIVGTTFQWPVNLSGQGGNPDFNLSISHTFTFGIYHQGTNDYFESQYFNITSKTVASPTTTSATTTATPRPTSGTTSSTAPTSTKSTTSNTSTTDPVSKGGLSKAAQAGIGVGVSVVGVAAIVGIIAFFLARRRRATNAKVDPVAAPEFSSAAIAKSYDGPPIELPPPSMRSPIELPPAAPQYSYHQLAELPEDSHNPAQPRHSGHSPGDHGS